MGATECNKVVIDKAREEFQEGLASLNDQQKMIRLADSSEDGWEVMKEYKDLYKFADNEEDSTKMTENTLYCIHFIEWLSLSTNSD